MEMISFLVTFYNQENYVKKCIDSILNISKSIEWEILIGDDGSTDNTIKYINEYLKKYPNNIRLYIMPRDSNKSYYPVKRVSENRLFLLEKSQGNYFCTIDGDDYYCDTKFLDYAIIEYNKHADASVVAFGYQTVKNNAIEKQYALNEESDAQLININNYIANMYIPAGACVFKNISKDRIKYIKEIGYYDDNDIFINNLNYGNVYSINRIIYSYTQKDDSTYNGMNYIEQSVLNVQGFDIEKLLIKKEYHRDLLRKYSLPIIDVYVFRRSLQQILGPDKYNYYLNSANNIEGSVLSLILNDQDIKYLIKELVKDYPFYYFKTQIKRILFY